MNAPTPHEPRLLPVVRRALAARDVEHEVEADPLYVSFRLAGEHAEYDFLIAVDEASEMVVCYARAARHVPAARRAAVCELLTRINYDLALGCFEMDLGDGELLFRTGVDAEGGALSAGMVDSLVSVAFYTFDRFHPTIMRVAYGGASPEEALAEMGESQ